MSRTTWALFFLVLWLVAGGGQAFRRSTNHLPSKRSHVTKLRARIEDMLNIVGGPLQPCSFLPVTGFLRDGFCNTCQEDQGSHTVCVRVTAKFLEFSARVGNDLSTASPEFGFAGLKPGDCWCLCAARWQQANLAGCAPEVVVAATHFKAAEVCGFADLMQNASADPTGADEMQ